MSAVVPVKSLHQNFDEAQRSLLSQVYPQQFEVLFAACEAEPAALAEIERLRSGFPHVPTRVVRAGAEGAASPKLDALWPALRDSKHDTILTKDSNLTLAAGELDDLAGELAPGIGLVSTIPIAREPRTFAAWTEAAILNNYHARLLMLADAIGLGFGLGKLMLFRRSDLMRAGGFESLSWALGEDMALARAMHSLGLRTALARRVSNQTLAVRSFAAVCQRQLRWMIVWRVQMPAAFVGDLLGCAVLVAFAGAAAAPMLGLTPWVVGVSTVTGWFVLESLLCLAKEWPLSPLSLPAFIAREILTPLLWLRACTTRKVVWAGAVRCAGRQPRGKRIMQPEAAPGGPR